MPVLETYERITTRYEAVEIIDPTMFLAPADPFEIDHDCQNPRGHIFVRDCCDVICVFCGRIAWG